jgi:hypothetical protein
MVQKAPFPGASSHLGTRTKALFNDKLCLIEFYDKGMVDDDDDDGGGEKGILARSLGHYYLPASQGGRIDNMDTLT